MPVPGGPNSSTPPGGDLRAQRLVARRVLEEVLDLVELLDGLVGAGDIGEGRLRHVLGQLLGLRFAESHDAAAATALHATHHEEEQAEQQDHRQHEDEDLPEHRLLVDIRRVLRAGVLDRVEDLLTGLRGGVLGADLVRVGVVHLDRGGVELDAQLLLAVVDADELGVLLVQLLQRDGGVDAPVLAVGVAHHAPAPQGEQDERQDGEVAEDCLTVHASWWGVRPACGIESRRPLRSHVLPIDVHIEATGQRSRW